MKGRKQYMEWAFTSGLLLWLCLMLYAKLCALQHYMQAKGYKLPNDDESYACFKDVITTWKQLIIFTKLEK